VAKKASSSAKKRPNRRIAGNSITYDTGTVTGTTGQSGRMLGSRFDSALNPAGTMCCFPVESSSSVTMITFDMVNTFFNSGIFSMYSNISGTTAMRLTAMSYTITMGLNTLSITMLATVTSGGGGGGNLNAVFRVSGNVATPVELINFTIE